MRRNGYALPRNQVPHDRKQRRQKHPAEVVYRKLPRTPLVFERGADEIVEIQRYRKPEDAVRFRHQREGQQPPYLPMQERRRVEIQKRVKRSRGIHHRHEIHKDVPDHDKKHQLRDPEFRMPEAKAVDFFVERSQAISPQ